MLTTQQANTIISKLDEISNRLLGLELLVSRIANKEEDTEEEKEEIIHRAFSQMFGVQDDEDLFEQIRY